jgi:hypothetical protein
MGSVVVSGVFWSGGTYGYNESTGMHHFSADVWVRYKDE